MANLVVSAVLWPESGCPSRQPAELGSSPFEAGDGFVELLDFPFEQVPNVVAWRLAALAEGDHFTQLAETEANGLARFDEAKPPEYGLVVVAVAGRGASGEATDGRGAAAVRTSERGTTIGLAATVVAVCCAAPIVLAALATVASSVARVWPVAVVGAVALAVLLLRRQHLKRRSR